MRRGSCLGADKFDKQLATIPFMKRLLSCSPQLSTALPLLEATSIVMYIDIFLSGKHLLDIVLNCHCFDKGQVEFVIFF